MDRSIDFRSVEAPARNPAEYSFLSDAAPPDGANGQVRRSNGQTSDRADARTARHNDFDFADFFENGGIALHLVGPDGTILHANRAELELLGYPAEDYIGRHVAEFHADPDVIGDILARLKRGETLSKYPARLRARDGSIRHVEITSSAQFRNGEFINTRCFTVDITELARARE